MGLREAELEWGWYASADEENYTVGPEASREDVIEAAIGDEVGLGDQNEDGSWNISFHILEARKEPVQMADYFHVGRWVEDLENGPFYDMSGEACGWNDDSIVSHIKSEQWTELQQVVRAAIAKWQSERDIQIRPWVFTESRNGEDISMVLPADEDANRALASKGAA
ncbi:hypothetical protein [Henriciella sp.]|uniref:hypothetical protein n=1 Tax=Henriciella sp. TaxID=1968823 RepID=UPI0026252D7C|nr:hypothetical protein [Henriciella sp.]